MRKILLLAAIALLGSSIAQGQASLTGAGAGCTPANCYSLGLQAKTTAVSFVLSGSWSATVQFEASADGFNWSSFNVSPLGATGSANSATAGGTWTACTNALAAVRVRVSAFSSGPIVASIQQAQTVQSCTMIPIRIDADTLPATPTAWDDDFQTNTLNPKWTIRNSAVVSVTPGAAIFSQTAATSGDVLRCMTQPLAGAGSSWTFAVKLGWAGGFGDSTLPRGALWLALFDSVSGKLKIYGPGTPSGISSIVIENFTNYTTFSAGVGGSPFNFGNAIASSQIPYVMQRFRIRNDGTLWHYEASIDGYAWGQSGSESVNTFLTPDSVGVCFDPQASSGITMTGAVDWFRKTN